MFFVYMILARILGPALYGTFGYTLSSIQIISGIFFDLGLFLIVTKELSAGRDTIFVPSLWLKVGGCVLGSMLLLLLIPVLNLPAVLTITLIGWAIFSSFADFYSCVFRAKNRMYGEAITIISQRALLLGMLALMYTGYIRVSQSSSLYACGLAYCCSGFLGLTMAFSLTTFLFPSLVEYREMKMVMQEVKSLANKALPLIGVSFFGFIYYKIDIVLLGILSTNEQVGFYNASYRILEASFLIPMIIINALYPKLSLLWVNDPGGFSKVFKKAVSASLLVALLVGLCLVVLAKVIIITLFGIEFEPSADILCLLAGALLVVYPGYIVTQSLVILGKQRHYLYVSMCAAAANIGLNFLFIPQWQAKGAAIATIITEASVTCAAALLIARHIKMRRQH